LKHFYATFSGYAYDITTKLIIDHAPQMGADEVLIYDDLYLTGTDFYRDNQWLWQHHGDANNVKRGFGWFAFKPWLLLDVLSRMNDGDLCLFTDADTYPIHDFSALYVECERIGGLMVFGAAGWHGCQSVWCKRDCFIAMGCDDPKYWYADHACARFMVIQKGPALVRWFLEEWQRYCINPLCTTFDKNVLGYPNIDGKGERLPWDGSFREHRCEQAILGNLVVKYGRRMYREACQYGDDPYYSHADRNLYPTLFCQDGRVGDNTLAGSAYRNV
jgi:hypothetical protein